MNGLDVFHPCLNIESQIAHTLQTGTTVHCHPTPSGTALSNIGSTAHQVHQSGTDPRVLGHWTWACFQGAQKSVQIIAIYHPDYNPAGPRSVSMVSTACPF